MSKEDILYKYPSQVQGDYYERHCLDAMDEYAEKVAVAFAEWAVRNCIEIQDGWVCQYGQFSTTSDLYQYFINNVYNK